MLCMQGSVYYGSIAFHCTERAERSLGHYWIITYRAASIDEREHEDDDEDDDDRGHHDVLHDDDDDYDYIQALEAFTHFVYCVSYSIIAVFL